MPSKYRTLEHSRKEQENDERKGAQIHMLTLIKTHVKHTLSFMHTHTHLEWTDSAACQDRKQRNGPSAYFGFQVRFQPLSLAAPDRFDYSNNHGPNLISTLFTAGCQPCVSAWATTSIYYFVVNRRKLEEEASDCLYWSEMEIYIVIKPDECGCERLHRRNRDENIKISL